ncbi:FMN-binding protein MioC [Edwardsiella tarda]|uniref:FMN-binding protein MioC n=3 Tax=Edwardsiella tarda TaxID=636 RepID=A0A2A7TYE0_EDWTA|nr:FMN-binding protein MioC [Edwardsiella tarda]AKH90502.1 FMN-binding protein MioC [Edwardsiella tarda]ATI64208.1 FMN-binding protein MioC [Edwardsiella tarda]EFE21175.1 flavodoxin [Edwardsiella tarda ATCC 23685]PEH71176.1 FMN-binding protein MioC [Edwardsiella tarda]UAL56751.1 FMN-binding protein MioC [Edwardsiella tarda]
MAHITVISGSTLGNAEYVAEHLADKLLAQGHEVQVLHGPELDEVPQQGIWLVVTSTHGAGELPDNLQPLFEQIETQQPDLTGIHFGAVGIGSSEYDTFCGGIAIVDRILIAFGAQRIGEVIKIDIKQHDVPEDPAEEWLAEWEKLIH